MKDIEIMDIDNTLENEVAETGSKVPEEKKKKNDIVENTVKKAVAVGVGAGLLTVGAVAALDNLPEVGPSAPQFSEPAPIVLEIDETDMDSSENTEEEQQEEKKRGFFSWLKIWFYGLCAGIAAFFATIALTEPAFSIALLNTIKSISFTVFLPRPVSSATSLFV